VSFALPGVDQSSELAELRALVHAVEGASDQQVSVTVKLDNAYVADQASAILGGSSAWPAAGHSLWKRLAKAQSALRATGAIGHSVCWIKGHSTKEDVAMGIITAEERVGNFAADALASKAAALHGCPEDVVKRAQIRPLLAAVVQSYLVEVLLSRKLALIDKYGNEDCIVVQESSPPSHAGPLDGPLSLAIKEAFYSLHCF
jgi:ribonuclease HI